MRVVPTPAASPQVTEAPPAPPAFNVKDLPGISGPLGFFDPLGVLPLCIPCAALCLCRDGCRAPAGFSTDASEGKIKFYREVELKHGRVAMLASLGATASPLSPPAAAARF